MCIFLQNVPNPFITTVCLFERIRKSVCVDTHKFRLLLVNFLAKNFCVIINLFFVVLCHLMLCRTILISISSSKNFITLYRQKWRRQSLHLYLQLLTFIFFFLAQKNLTSIIVVFLSGSVLSKLCFVHYKIEKIMRPYHLLYNSSSKIADCSSQNRFSSINEVLTSWKPVLWTIIWKAYYLWTKYNNFYKIYVSFMLPAFSINWIPR